MNHNQLNIKIEHYLGVYQIQNASNMPAITKYAAEIANAVQSVGGKPNHPLNILMADKLASMTGTQELGRHNVTEAYKHLGAVLRQAGYVEKGHMAVKLTPEESDMLGVLVATGWADDTAGFYINIKLPSLRSGAYVDKAFRFKVAPGSWWYGLHRQLNVPAVMKAMDDGTTQAFMIRDGAWYWCEQKYPTPTLNYVGVIYIGIPLIDCLEVGNV